MDPAARKDTIASAAVLLAILLSALCGVFAVDVQATSDIDSSTHASQASCESRASAFVVRHAAL